MQKNPKIIKGMYKLKRLKVPKNTRPVTNFIKSKIFDYLNIESIKESIEVLDLYAGSGSYGFEAISRGAIRCTFVDSSAESERFLKEFAEKNNISNIKFIKSDVLVYLYRHKIPENLIFIDPPFSVFSTIFEETLLRIVLSRMTKPSAVVVVRSPKRYFTNKVLIYNKFINIIRHFKSGSSCIKIYLLTKLI